MHESSSGIGNIPELDGLRGIAILMVVFLHFWAHSSPAGSGIPLNMVIGDLHFDLEWFFKGGSNGVRVFFVLSAFLLYLPFALANLKATALPRVWKFYRRRMLRILPAYYFVIAAYALLVFLAGFNTNSARLTPWNISASSLFLQPIAGLFARGTSLDVVPGSWSLAPEIYFYMLLPLFAYLTRKRLPFVLLMAAMLAGGPLFRHYLETKYSTADFFLLYRFSFPAFMDIFGFGILAARIYAAYRAEFRDAGSRLSKYARYLVLPGIVIFFYTWFSFAGQKLIVDREFQMGFGILLFVLGILSAASAAAGWLRSNWLRYTGIVSYSLFLIHITLVWYPINTIFAVLQIWNPAVRFLCLLLFGIPLSIALASVCYRRIEKPFLNKNISFRSAVGMVQRPLFTAAASILAFSLVFSFINIQDEVYTGHLFQHKYSLTSFAKNKIKEYYGPEAGPEIIQLWRGVAPEDFSVYSSLGASNIGVERAGSLLRLVCRKEDAGSWLEISAVLNDSQIKALRGKQVSLTGRIGTNRPERVQLGIYDGFRDLGSPEQPAADPKEIRLQTQIRPGGKDPQFKINVFPGEDGPVIVTFQDIQIDIMK